MSSGLNSSSRALKVECRITNTRSITRPYNICTCPDTQAPALTDLDPSCAINELARIAPAYLGRSCTCGPIPCFAKLPTPR